MTTTENEQRDELARDIFVADNSKCAEEIVLADWARPDHHYPYVYGIADGLIAKGYRKPRTIATVEELDALPMGAAVLDSRRTVWVNDGDTVAPWASLGEGNYEGGPIWVHSVDITLPAAVLWEPEAGVGA